jgi:hypothetical protein
MVMELIDRGQKLKDENNSLTVAIEGRSKDQIAEANLDADSEAKQAARKVIKDESRVRK